MINVWEKRDGCWMNIGSPDFVREQRLRGYLETRRHGLSILRGLKKNSMRTLRHNSSESLRQDGSLYTGFILRGCPGIPASGGSACILPEMQESEDRRHKPSFQQSLLHQEVCLYSWPEMPCNYHKGCGKGIQTGLAGSQRRWTKNTWQNK